MSRILVVKFAKPIYFFRIPLGSLQLGLANLDSSSGTFLRLFK